MEAAGVKAGHSFLQFMAQFADLSGEDGTNADSLCKCIRLVMQSCSGALCQLAWPRHQEFRPLVRTVLDIWLPLAMGCATVIAPAEQMKDVEAVRGLIARHGVTCMTTVPSMFQVLVCSALNQTNRLQESHKEPSMHVCLPSDRLF